jgi:hypothetical protein
VGRHGPRKGKIHKRGWEHVAAAKELVARHGALPPASWLLANGHNGLYQWLSKHPEILKTLPRQKRVYSNNLANLLKERWENEKKVAKKLKGMSVPIGRSHGAAVYTGNLNVAQHPGGVKNWVPEIKCSHCESVIKRSEKDSFPTCWNCVQLAGGLSVWKRYVAIANTFGMTATAVMQKRDSQTIKGLVCCAICGLAETGQRHSQDHDQRYQKRGGKGNRDLLCGSCNMKVVPVAEKIVAGKMSLPPRTDGGGWSLLVKAIQYIEMWDKKLGVRFARPPKKKSPPRQPPQ